MRNSHGRCRTETAAEDSSVLPATRKLKKGFPTPLDDHGSETSPGPREGRLQAGLPAPLDFLLSGEDAVGASV